MEESTIYDEDGIAQVVRYNHSSSISSRTKSSGL